MKILTKIKKMGGNRGGNRYREKCNTRPYIKSVATATDPLRIGVAGKNIAKSGPIYILLRKYRFE